MNTKRALGYFLILMGLYIIITGRVITGAVIGFQPQNYLSLLGVLVFIIGVFLVLAVGLEERVRAEPLLLQAETNEEDNSAHSVINYEKLKFRLKYMQDNKLKGVNPDKVPIGRYLSESEEQKIKEILLKYLPDEIKEKDVEISISGSLSQREKGKRMHGKLGIDEKLSSDQFYLSDVDINIAGNIPFDYIESKWATVIMRQGRKKSKRGGTTKTTGKLADKASYRITTDDLNKREKQVGYMREAPEWAKRMLKELSAYSFAGEKRPVNVKFFKGKEVMNPKPRDILYYRD